MTHLAKRLEQLEERGGANKVHVIREPAGLSDDESDAWFEANTSASARATAGISPRSLIVVIRRFGEEDDE